MTPSRKLTPQICAMYLGAECEYGYPDNKKFGRIVGYVDPFGVQVSPMGAGTFFSPNINVNPELIKLILRPLSSMTEEENKELYCGSYIRAWHPAAFLPAEFQWLLSKSFDIFNLIPDGLALELDKAKKG